MEIFGPLSFWKELSFCLALLLKFLCSLWPIEDVVMNGCKRLMLIVKNQPEMLAVESDTGGENVAMCDEWCWETS